MAVQIAHHRFELPDLAAQVSVVEYGFTARGRNRIVLCSVIDQLK